MKRLACFLAVLFVFQFGVRPSSAQICAEDFYYLSPEPGAELVARGTTIIFRPRSALRSSGIDWTSLIRAEGSISGLHLGEWIVANDLETFIFKPRAPFAEGEEVKVFAGETTENARPEYLFSFRISPKKEDRYREMWDSMNSRWIKSLSSTPTDAASHESFESPTVATVYTLPSDFPSLAVTCADSPTPGYIFLSSMAFFIDPRPAPYLMILDNTGAPVFFRKMPDIAVDFKKQSNGLLTYWVRGANKFYAMDNTYTVVDSFEAGNGYVTDLHELVIEPNGHALLMIYDYQPVDMSKIVEGGDSAATVIGLVIQELDQSKNVVFQWRSWDHFEITDARHRDLTADLIDYVHGNAIEPDFDGNIMISSRHLDEITKIDRRTGEIIWRLGGNNNQFTLVNDSIWFSYQHDIRRLPNGHITLFDNGNFNSPQESRAVEYELDVENMTATLVWEYRNTPPTYGAFMGNAQRLPNGNTFIGWGGTSPALTEVRADGGKSFELAFQPGVFSYRAFRASWDGVAAVPYLWADTTNAILTLNFAKFGDENVEQYFVYRGNSPSPTTRVASTSGNSAVVRNFSSGDTLYFRVSAVDYRGNESPFSNEIAIVPGFEDIPPVVPAVVDIDPGTLNAKSKGRWITADIELAEDSDYSLDEVDRGSILINDVVSSEIEPSAERDSNGNGVPDLMVKFPREDVLNILPAAGTTQIKVSGTVGDAVFEGVAEIRVIHSTDRTAFEQEERSKSGHIVLCQNTPNPFNPLTTIRFSLPVVADVDLDIYSVTGSVVRHLEHRRLSAGTHSVTWDGRDMRGNPVGSGVYLYRLKAGETVLKRKMILLK